jgi:hypothetical protein
VISLLKNAITIPDALHELLKLGLENILAPDWRRGTDLRGVDNIQASENLRQLLPGTSREA